MSAGFDIQQSQWSVCFILFFVFHVDGIHVASMQPVADNEQVEVGAIQKHIALFFYFPNIELPLIETVLPSLVIVVPLLLMVVP